ncbi:Putative short-chain fatty acid transporter [Pseudomonas aeruginosa]|nr:Putative short-chain fatty acid transporter [Pseudomonas aeruginosa]
MQANPASLPPSILAITGVIPFTETIFLWQSGVMLLALILVSLVIAYMTAPSAASARDAKDCGVDVSFTAPARLAPARRVAGAQPVADHPAGTAGRRLAGPRVLDPAILAISGLNTYNLLFLMLGALLHWRPRSFRRGGARGADHHRGADPVPAVRLDRGDHDHGRSGDGETLAHHISTFFVQIASHDTYALLMGVYSAVLGFFIPSGGGKWIIEAPYVMQVANELQYHLGWAVQIYNAAEALPNLINPFYMLPLLGVLGLKARDLIGFSFVQLLVHIPLVLVLLWALGSTLAYIPPVMP